MADKGQTRTRVSENTLVTLTPVIETYDGSDWVTTGKGNPREITLDKLVTILNDVTSTVDEAPEDGSLYARKNGDWVKIPIQADAPEDTNTYGRKDGNWEQLA